MPCTLVWLRRGCCERHFCKLPLFYTRLRPPTVVKFLFALARSMNQRASRSGKTNQPTVNTQSGVEVTMAEKKECKEKGCVTLQKRSPAYLEYENLTQLPQNAPLAELDENAYPILHMGERFCRLPGKHGKRICGLRFGGAAYISLLTKHFSDAHGLGAEKKPPFQRGMNKGNEVIEREVAWYENLMQSMGYSPKRKADAVLPEEVVTPPKSKKQKQTAALPAAPSPLQEPVKPAATPAPAPSASPAATEPEQLPSDPPAPPISGAIALPTAGAPSQTPIQLAKTSVPATSVCAAAPQHQQLLRRPPPLPEPASSALTAAPQPNQLPNGSLPSLTPGSIAIVAESAPQAPTVAPPAPTRKPTAMPQDQYTQTYIASYNNGWNDCEREYQQRVAELEAEKAAFEREKAQFHALRTRFGGELKEMLREIEGNR
ncbi:hypothetical protein AC579_8607 [Pseudocercospora musae]|uniref:Uncharacterized protein n=1 Tax=Pseudocercospora musae TaxID=113226 RepID=A0A139I4N0_9PEZI|nr:hypothetical protein AC579_8607 [Pseudocercospora musae]